MLRSVMARPIVRRPLRIDGNLAYITLTRGYEAVIDAADADQVRLHSWHASVKASGDVYAAAAMEVDGRVRHVGLHRFLTAAPAGRDVDHINGDPMDNRRVNLRLCTRLQNMQNRRRHRTNSVGLRGVMRYRDGYRSMITFAGVRYHLGCFATKEEASAAYETKARELRGEFA